MKENIKFVIITMITIIFFTPNQIMGQTDSDSKFKISGIGQEEVWPLVYDILQANKLSISDFNYGQNTLQSDYFYFVDLLYRYRTKFIFKYEDFSLTIINANVEQYDNNTWQTNPLFSKKKRLNKAKESMIDYIKKSIQNTEHMTHVKTQFYTDLDVTKKFFEHATELAGNRWFENYLKNKQINWKLTFADLKENKSEQYKYVETYFYAPNNSVMNSMTKLLEAKFSITKYTNNDKNVFTAKGTILDITGYCQRLIFNNINNVFYILITDEATSDLTNINISDNETKSKEDNNSSKASLADKADELVKIKILLDQGIITQEEYDKEKQKIIEK
jgi:hypothetical protein